VAIVNESVEGDRASVGIQVDGQPVIEWSGAQADLAPHNQWRQPDLKAIGVGGAGAVFEFKKIVAQPLGGGPARGSAAAAAAVEIVPNQYLPEMQPMLAELKQRDPELFKNARRIEMATVKNADSLGIDANSISGNIGGSYGQATRRGKRGVKDFIVAGAIGRLEAGEYLAVFRLNHRESDKPDTTLCTIELTSGGRKFADRTVTLGDVPHDAWTPVGFRFTVDSAKPADARVWQNGRPVAVDRVYVFRVSAGAGPAAPNPRPGAGRGANNDPGEAIRTAFERKFVEGISNAYRNAGPQQKPLLLNGIRQRFTQLPEDKRATVIEVLKENGNDELLRELQRP